MPYSTAPVLDTCRNTMWVHVCRHISGTGAAQLRCTAPPKVPFSNGYTVIMLDNVTAGGYTSVNTIRTRHTHCPNTFKTSEINFISILPLEMARGMYAKHPPQVCLFCSPSVSATSWRLIL